MRLPGQVVVLALVAFAVAVGFGIVAPIIPLFATDFGAGKAAAGAVVSAFAFMRLTFSLGSGRLVNRFGERAVLAAGLAIVAATSLAAGFARSYAELLVFRGVGGIGSAMFTVSAVTLLLRVVRPDQRGQANSWFQGGFLAGGLAGPAVGGALATISLRAPFFVYAGTLGVAFVISLAALRRTPDTHGRLPNPGEAPEPRTRGDERTGLLRTALGHRAYQAALITNLGTGWVLFGIRSSLVPLFVADALGRSAVWVGIGFVVGSLAQAVALWPAGRFVDRVGRKPAIVWGGLLATVSMVVLVTIQTLPGFLVAMACYGIAAAFLGTAPGAVVGDVIAGQREMAASPRSDHGSHGPERGRGRSPVRGIRRGSEGSGGRGGTVVAAYQMAGDIGAIIGPLLAGWLADEVGFGAAFGAGAIILASSALLATRMPETGSRQAHAANPK